MWCLALNFLRITGVYEDYKSSELVFDSGHGMELDCYAPDLYLAVEYQGEQHFSNVFPFGQQKDIAQRDKQKREACAKVNGTFFVDYCRLRLL